MIKFIRRRLFFSSENVFIIRYELVLIEIILLTGVLEAVLFDKIHNGIVERVDPKEDKRDSRKLFERKLKYLIEVGLAQIVEVERKVFDFGGRFVDSDKTVAIALFGKKIGYSVTLGTVKVLFDNVIFGQLFDELFIQWQLYPFVNLYRFIHIFFAEFNNIHNSPFDSSKIFLSAATRGNNAPRRRRMLIIS